ncbi:MAG: Arc family DNA binding domain-containing protein [Bacteroidetes bacterium]|nr:Arc family DNA binding domain-containing protein [Bacteroidota bacterium]
MARKAFVLRIDEKLLAAVEKWAADEFRSTNGQLEWIVARALQQAGRLRNDAPDEQPNTSNPES